jgi:predicted nucleic acid-binding protein
MPDRFTRTVVCNTGPLLALSRVGQVGLLARLFPEVIIPMEVIEELLQTPHGDVAILRRELAQFRQLTTLPNPTRCSRPSSMRERRRSSPPP